MNRVIAVVVGAFVLLLVGYLMGSRPVGGLKEEIKELKQLHTEELNRVRTQAHDALGEGYLWQARAQFMVAAQDVAESNFGTAANRVAEAVDLVQRAQALPSISLNLGPVESQAAKALEAVRSLKPESQEQLLKVASDLGALLERREA